VQVPEQVVIDRGAHADQAFAVVDEQPRVELRTGELGHRQRVEAFADRRAGDRDGVDDVGLPTLTSRVAGAGHQPGRHPHDALAAGEQEPLQRSGDVPAVLDRPHPLRIVEAASPEQQILERTLLGRHRSVDEHAPGRLVDRRDRV
jgi:hypothetical protein